MVYDPYPPYTMLATGLHRLRRPCSAWCALRATGTWSPTPGRFANTMPRMLGVRPFENFMAFSDWLYAKTDATHRIALDRLAKLVAEWLQVTRMARERALALVASDYAGGSTAPARRNSPAIQAVAAPAGRCATWQPEHARIVAEWQRPRILLHCNNAD